MPEKSSRDYESYVSPDNVMYRRVNNSHFCRFSPKASYHEYQWFGMHLPFTKDTCQFKVSYRIRFLKGSCIARWKTHSPDRTSHDWFTNPVEWHDIMSDSVSYFNSPFIFLFLDDILNADEIIVEIADIKLIKTG